MDIKVRTLKRLVDVVGAGAGLVIAAPLLPAIAAAIYVDSPGPVLFRQRRAGALVDEGVRAGKGLAFVEFEMLKFRSMRLDAEKLTGPVISEENDARITTVGRILRRTRLDELPQLWNVLKGDMSLVGPRPERPELMQQLAAAIPFFEERMRSVRPGITGMSQVHLSYTGRPRPGSEVQEHLENLVNPFDVEGTEGALADDMRIKLLYDLSYVAALDRLGDYLRTELRVICKTPLVMLRGLGR